MRDLQKFDKINLPNLPNLPNLSNLSNLDSNIIFNNQSDNIKVNMVNKNNEMNTSLDQIITLDINL